MGSFIKAVKDFFKINIADIFIPPSCHLCEVVLSTHNGLCPKCFLSITMLDENNACDKCAVPFTGVSEDNRICGKCISDPPLFTKARSAFVYDHISARLLINLKHFDSTYIARTLAAQMMRVGKDILTPNSLLVPVPLSIRKLHYRQYNQSALLAQEITKVTGIKHNNELLLKFKETESQEDLTKEERILNLKGAFKVNPDYQDWVSKFERIIIVDDVLTTGSTANECTKALMKAGAKEVMVLTAARVP